VNGPKKESKKGIKKRNKEGRTAEEQNEIKEERTQGTSADSWHTELENWLTE